MATKQLTIRIPEDLFRRLKAAAALQGLSLQEFLTKALEAIDTG